MSVTSQRYSEAVSTAVCIALMLLTSPIAVAQGPLQPSGDFLSGLKHRLSPENMLPYRDTTPRQPLSRQPPPGQNSWNVELVGMTGGAVYDVPESPFSRRSA